MPQTGSLDRLIRATALCALADGLFACAVSMGLYGSTFARLWQGVASVPFGKVAVDGGTAYTVAGLLLHIGVALGWSTVFLLAYERSHWLRDVVDGHYGVLKVAMVFGPMVWVVMSLVVIPLMTGRPPNITERWAIQLVGHAASVGWPIVASIRLAPRTTTAPPVPNRATGTN